MVKRILLLTIVLFSGAAYPALPPNACATIFDGHPPVLSPFYEFSIPRGEPFVPPRVTAWDEYYGDLTSDIVVWDNVDTSASGVYYITYDVCDPAGNCARQAIQRVYVLAEGETLPVSGFGGISVLFGAMLVLGCMSSCEKDPLLAIREFGLESGLAWIRP
jgi:hypothetical protein